MWTLKNINEREKCLGLVEKKAIINYIRDREIT